MLYRWGLQKNKKKSKKILPNKYATYVLYLFQYFNQEIK